jgi:imidazoleglycerol-phosphate dehydratase
MRTANIHRQTSETDILLQLTLDGTGKTKIQTGIGFLDHMLELFAFHGLFDLTLEATGDLNVDAHHTVEDCALALGTAIDEALADRAGLHRIATAHVPMDEALAFVAVDLSGRPYAVIQAQWNAPIIGTLPTSLLVHFFESLAITARANLHASILYGRDDHHKAEALFKALGRAMDIASRIDARRAGGIPSTKGSL